MNEQVNVTAPQTPGVAIEANVPEFLKREAAKKQEAAKVVQTEADKAGVDESTGSRPQ